MYLKAIVALYWRDFSKQMDSEEAVAEKLSELEQNALERRKRLKELRARFTGNGQNGMDSEGDEKRDTEPVSFLFRSYKPAVDAQKRPHIGNTKEEIDALAQNIADQLEASEDTKLHDELDLKTLAPRKVDWDLRRGIQEKLDKLERRTKKAINQIIRQRLNDAEESEGVQQMELLAAAVGSIGEEQRKE